MSGNFAIKGGGVGRLMANAILNFHFDFPHTSLISILELASNCYISDIIDIVHQKMDMHHMMDVHHMMNTHYDDVHPSYVGQPS